MRDDATAWINLGDSYAGSGRGPTGQNGIGNQERRQGFDSPRVVIPDGVKPKDRLGIPHRVVFALQDAGFYWRDEIVWHKNSPMPESVTDRCTKSHEFLFMLSKAERYYYDQDAIREPNNWPEGRWSDRHRYCENDLTGLGEHHGLNRTEVNPAGRNKRSVWTINPAPWRGAHFAVMPSALVEPCIRAGTSERGVCPRCGKPWERVTERETEAPAYRPTNRPIRRLAASDAGQGTNGTGQSSLGMVSRSSSRGWSPTCPCDAGPPVPALVLDPFAGAGTVAVVANALGRRSIGVDLNPEYLAMARRRIDRPHASLKSSNNGNDLPLFSHMEED